MTFRPRLRLLLLTVLCGAVVPVMAQTRPATAKSAPARSAELAPAARKAVEEVTPIDDDPNVRLTEAELELSRQVHIGDIPCELGATVRIRPARRDGLFLVSTRNYRFLMHPVESRTGALRLEDPKRGAMWLQLGNKSMLMSQKLGQRLADECQSPAQKTVAEELLRNPRPSILDAAPAPAAPAAAAAPATAVGPASAPAN